VGDAGGVVCIIRPGKFFLTTSYMQNRHISVTFLLFLLSLVLCPLYALAQTEIATVPQALDLQTDAARARSDRIPILLMIARSDCVYCAQLKREIIGPMLVSGRYADKVIIRELLLDDPQTIVDFNGAPVSAAELGRRYREQLTPTVLLLAADGRELVTRIRGISNIEYYGYYLDKAIGQARAALL
jgi:thioredoxin-related protein